MRRIWAVVPALALAMNPALGQAQTLPPGKPAGMSEAQLNNHQLFVYLTIGGLLVTAAGAALPVVRCPGVDVWMRA